jgi:hypothetical protein
MHACDADTAVWWLQVFPAFQAADRLGALLELLEPHILSDDFESLAPEVMQALVEHFSSRGGWQGCGECSAPHADTPLRMLVLVSREQYLAPALCIMATVQEEHSHP